MVNSNYVVHFVQYEIGSTFVFKNKIQFEGQAQIM